MFNTPWYTNISLWTAVVSWLVAQSVKMLQTFIHTRRVDFRTLVSTGGMPSAHSALVCGLATSVGLRSGFGSPLFAVTAILAGVVMFDAQSVRRAAGMQAQILNQMVDELFKEHHLSENRLAELLGHTRLEVFFGMVTGIVVGLFLHTVY